MQAGCFGLTQNRMNSVSVLHKSGLWSDGAQSSLPALRFTDLTPQSQRQPHKYEKFYTKWQSL